MNSSRRRCATIGTDNVSLGRGFLVAGWAGKVVGTVVYMHVSLAYQPVTPVEL